MFNWLDNNKGVIIFYMIIVTFSLILVHDSKNKELDNYNNKELIVINK